MAQIVRVDAGPLSRDHIPTIIAEGLERLDNAERIGRRLGGPIGANIRRCAADLRNARLSAGQHQGLGIWWLLPAIIGGSVVGADFIRIVQGWFGQTAALSETAECIGRLIELDPTLTAEQAAALCEKPSGWGVPAWAWGALIGVGVVALAALLLRRR